MASFRSANSGNNGAGSTSLTISAPSGVANDDILVMAATALGGSGVYTNEVLPFTEVSSPGFTAAPRSGRGYGNYMVFGANAGLLRYSSDGGNTWTTITESATGNFMNIVHRPGLWVAAANATSNNIVYINSDDPSGSWTTHSITGPSGGIVAFAYGGGYWYAGYVLGVMAYSSSLTASSWSTVDIGNPNFRGAVGGNGYIVATTDEPGVYRTAWGTTPSFSKVSSADLADIEYDEAHNTFIAVGSGNMYYSEDNGSTWTVSGGTYTAASFQKVSVHHGIAISCGGDGSGTSANIVVSSDGGKTFFDVTPPSIDQLHASAIDDQGRVAVGGQPTTGTVHVSPGSLIGWTRIGTTSYSTSIRQTYWWKKASNEGSSYSLGIQPSAKASGVIAAISAADTTTPVAGSGGQGNASSVNITAPAISGWSQRAGVDLGLFGTAGTTTISVPTDYTEPANGESSANSPGVTTQVSYRSLDPVTSVASIVATGGSAYANIGQHVFIQGEPEIPSPVSVMLIGSAL